MARPAVLRSRRSGSALRAAAAEQHAAIRQEMAAVQRRSALASNAAVTFLVIASAGMAVARYLR